MFRAQVVVHKRNDIDINFPRIVHIRGNTKKVLRPILCNFPSLPNVKNLLTLMGGLSGGETVMLHVRSSRNARPPPEAELLHSTATHRNYFLRLPTSY